MKELKLRFGFAGLKLRLRRIREFPDSVKRELERFGEFTAHLPEVLRGERDPEGWLQTCLFTLLQVFAMGAIFPAPVLDHKEALLRNWVKSDARMFGHGHKYCIRNLMTLAEFYRSRYLYGEASVWYEKALSACRKSLTPGDPELGSVCSTVAGFYSLYAKDELSRDCYLLALESRAVQFGANALELCDDLRSLAEVYLKLCQPAEAERCYLRELEINEEVRGPTHEDLQLPLIRLACFYKSVGWEEKLRLAEEHLRLFNEASLIEESLGEDHFLLAKELDAFALFYRRQKKTQLSDMLSERACMLRLMKKVQGQEYPGLVDDLLVLSGYLKSRARPGDSTTAFRMEQRGKRISFNLSGGCSK